MEGEIITMSEIFKFRRERVDESGNVIGTFRATGIVPEFQNHFAKRGIDLPMAVFDPDAEMDDQIPEMETK